jgi:PAS domain S-box-containing protein
LNNTSIQVEPNACVLAVHPSQALLDALNALSIPGIAVLIADQIETARECILTQRPHLILLESEETGSDLAAACRLLKTEKLAAAIPVLAIASVDDADNFDAWQAAGILDIVFKPLRAVELGWRIQQYLPHPRQFPANLAVPSEPVSASLEPAYSGCFYTLVQTVDGREFLASLSQGWQELTGIAPEVAIRDIAVFRTLIEAEDAEKINAAKIESRQHLSPCDMAFRIRHPFRGERWIAAYSLPQRMADGSTEWHGFMYDITERKNAEEKLWSSEQSFRAIVDHSPDTIVRYDQSCRRLFVSGSYFKTHGLTPSDVVGAKPSETPWHSGSMTSEMYETAILEVFRTGKTTDIEFDWSAPDGEVFYHWVRAVPEYDRQGNVVCVLAMVRDTSDMKRTESLLRRREFEFRTLAHNSPDMIIRYDLQCRQAYLNPAFERFTGIPLAKAWNKAPAANWNALTPCDDYLARLTRVMETGKPDRILLEWRMPDQSLSAHLLHAVAEHDEEGNTIGALVIGHNITDLKATERSLEESRAQLQMLTYHREEAREGERKRIAREIHDELGQLLSVLRLGISTLDYGYGDTNPDLRSKTAKMGAVVDQAIDMVHTLATRLRPAVLESGIALALEWLVQEFSKSTGIDCKLSVPEEEVDFDKDRALPVFRIVQESLTNILRHSEADHVEIALTQDRENLKLSIRDNGKGFEVSKATKKGSFGIIGMHERILMLGGSLEIESAPGSGTEIRLEVPLKTKEEIHD